MDFNTWANIDIDSELAFHMKFDLHMDMKFHNERQYQIFEYGKELRDQQLIGTNKDEN